MKKSAVFLSSLLASGAALADDDERTWFYIGASYVDGNLVTFQDNPPQRNTAIDPKNYRISVGVRPHENLAAELQWQGNLDQYEFGANNSSSIEVKRAVSLFIKPNADLAFDGMLRVNGFIGYTDMRFEADFNGTIIEGDEAGLSYGVGIEANPWKHIQVTSDFIMYFDDNDQRFYAPSVGLQVAF